MIERGHAYEVGFTTLHIGFHFNGAAILEVARRTAGAPLVARVDQLLAGWPARGPKIVAAVRLVEQRSRDAGIATPTQPPRDLDEYLAWADAIRKGVEASLADREGVPQAERIERWKRKWTYLLGTTIGDAVQVLELGAMIALMRDAEPAHEWLRAQGKALADNQRALAARLRKLIDDNQLMRNFGEATVAGAERIHAALATSAAADALEVVSQIDLRTTFAG